VRKYRVRREKEGSDVVLYPYNPSYAEAEVRRLKSETGPKAQDAI
jgi:hypothetical protein